MFKKILAIGSHFDDIEIGIGGTLIKHLDNGDEIYLAVIESDEFRTGSPKDRFKEQKEVLKILNIPQKNLFLFENQDLNFDIVGELDLLKPTIIYTMFEKDTHFSHTRASIIGQAVGRKLYTQVVFYNSGSSIDFSPNIFSIIDFLKKQVILNCFKTQIEYGAINLDFIERRESFWASLITDKHQYAEGFVIRKMLYNI